MYHYSEVRGGLVSSNAAHGWQSRTEHHCGHQILRQIPASQPHITPTTQLLPLQASSSEFSNRGNPPCPAELPQKQRACCSAA
jgi:hypothetical protein